MIGADACEVCGVLGCHVDTTANEVVRNGEVVAVAPAEALKLMVDERGWLVCDACHEQFELCSVCGLPVDDHDRRGDSSHPDGCSHR